MYIPRANEETRIPVMHRLIIDQSLGTLVTMNASGLIASHIPFYLDADGSEFGLLKGHISRANTQWRDLTPAIDALAIFAGPQHYISPAWYQAKQEDGKVVPTWNYAVVHAYGPLQLISDADWLLAHLHTLTDQHEESFPTPWKVTDAPQQYIETMMKGIIGFALPIRKLEGKWKLSQNRSDADRTGVVEGLARLGTPESSDMKELVEAAMHA